MTVYKMGVRANNSLRWRKAGKRMVRIARVVVPGLPHHVTQRGNRREPVFFGADYYQLYRCVIATGGAALWPRISASTQFSCLPTVPSRYSLSCELPELLISGAQRCH